MFLGIFRGFSEGPVPRNFPMKNIPRNISSELPRIGPSESPSKYPDEVLPRARLIDDLGNMVKIEEGLVGCLPWKMLTMTGRNSPEVQGCSVIPKDMHGAHDSMGLAVAKMAYHVSYLVLFLIFKTLKCHSVAEDRCPAVPVPPRPVQVVSQD
ncbi:hypothetical protein DY000_02046829 [Brassica cretica]|uniref:Uncharacterized protein n=1 Tax=Brassica cretica TaxID=69181 RepID=A0ABQ7ESP0_BRACR|nr:hypothetical protein DY000_02046829 [Brassica cretica]